MSIDGDDYGVEVPPTYNVGDESVFDPTYSGTLPPVMGGGDESVFDPTYGGTLPITSSIDTSGLSGILKKFFSDGKGGLDLLKLGALGGGLAGLLGGNKSSSTPSGYQGSIPKYTATRNMVTAPTPGRRPGAGGTRYGGDVSFTPKGSSPIGGGLASLVGRGLTGGSPAVDANGNPVLTADNGMTEAYLQAANKAPALRAIDAPENNMRTVDPSQYATNYAVGGMAKGRYLQGSTDGMADKIPAQIGKDQPAALSHGEFVVPADVVSHLGNGNSDAGAQKLYSMMDKIRQARTGTKKQGKEINPDKFMPGGLAQAYAAGGTVQRYAEGGISGVGTAANAGVTGTESNLSNWAGPYVTDMLGKGQALSEMPYQEYGGPLTAGASGLQNKVFSGLSNVNFPGNLGQSFASPMGGRQQPPMMLNQGSNGFGDFGNMQATQPLGDGARAPGSMLDMMRGGNFISGPSNGGVFDPLEGGISPGAADTTNYGSAPTINSMLPQGGIAGLPQQPPQGSQQPSNIAQSYMNPYLQSVLDPQMAELRRQNAITNMGTNAKLTSAGAFGGGRQAIMNAENNRNLMQEMNKTVGQGYSNAYDKAMQQFNTEQGQGMGLANLMAQQGATERGIESEGIAADKAAFEEARANPYKMVQFQQSLLSGLPLAAQNINTAQPSTFANVLTGAGSVASLLNNLGLGPKK